MGEGLNNRVEAIKKSSNNLEEIITMFNSRLQCHTDTERRGGVVYVVSRLKHRPTVLWHSCII